jgi:hypothetical protein
MPFALADGEGKGLNYICFEVLRRIRAKVEYQYVASRLIRDEETFAPSEWGRYRCGVFNH